MNEVKKCGHSTMVVDSLTVTEDYMLAFEEGHCGKCKIPMTKTLTLKELKWIKKGEDYCENKRAV